MARIRSIKPETWTSPEFVACSPLARLLWIGTWNFADDYGVLKDDPAMLKLQILPADDCDAHELVDELVERNLLQRRIATDGTQVLVVRTFTLHQRIDKRSPGRWGDPTTFGDNGRALSAIPTNPHQSQQVPTDHHPGGDGKGSLSCPPAAPPYESDFAACWEVYPRTDGRKAAFTAYQARRRQGIPHGDLLAAATHYATATQSKEPEFLMLGKTFFGPSERWCDFVQPPKDTRDPYMGVVNR